MKISYKQAQEVFAQISEKYKCPSQDPDYVMLDSTRDRSLEPTFFYYEEQGSIYYHAFHVAPVPDTPYYDIQTPYGYGGPISTSHDHAFLRKAWKAYKNWVAERKILVEFIRFHPLLENWHYYQGDVFFDRETVWIDLMEGDLHNQYQTRARRKIRKAIKNGLTVHWVTYKEFFEHFPSIYNNLMHSLQAGSFYYFPESYYNAWQQIKNVHFAVCKKQDQVVATIFFYNNNDMMEYHLSASSELGKELAATPLIIHEAALHAKQLGCTKLHLGGGTDNQSDNPLFFFKSGFSNERGRFNIGKTIHLANEYEKLKKTWQKNGSVSNRVLFYRM